MRMRSSLVVRASDCQCTSCNGPGFDPSIRRHSGIWGAADEAVLNKVRKKYKKNPPLFPCNKLFSSRLEVAVGPHSEEQREGAPGQLPHRGDAVHQERVPAGGGRPQPPHPRHHRHPHRHHRHQGWAPALLRIRIRDPVTFWPQDPGSQTHIFESFLVKIFWAKTSIILWKLAQIFFFSISKIK